MPLPVIAIMAPLGQVFVIIFKLILLGSVKLFAIAIGAYLAPKWTDKKLRQLSLNAAIHEVSLDRRLKDEYSDISDEEYDAAERVIAIILQRQHTKERARTRLKGKLYDAYHAIVDGIIELPHDVMDIVRATITFVRKKRGK